ncbi:hypothetical protein [Spongorhabdus nitratireducens]
MSGQYIMRFFLLLVSTLLLACSTQPDTPVIDPSSKIRFDLAILDDAGLYGPGDGLRSLSYEFCIPADEKHMDEVLKIDPTLVVFKHSRGRIGCTSKQYLCIGNTFQEDFASVLEELSNKHYIKSIEQSFFE